MSHRIVIHEAPLPGLKILEGRTVGDQRGFLERLFSEEDLQSLLGDRHIVEINQTMTLRRGTVRGMHYQAPPHAEMKFVRCLRGSVFDIAVDVRGDSPTFLQWHGETLGEDDLQTMLIPEGFAHGFQTLTDNCELLYFHTAAYAPSAERGLNPKDPRLAIAWPDAILELSQRDASFPMLDTADVGSGR